MSGQGDVTADVKILRAAREKISAPGAWTQRITARNALGQSTQSRSSDAVCWCARGALWAVSDDSDSPVEWLTAAADVGLIYFNDTPGRTQAEVLAVFDKAIALAEATA